MSDSEPDPFQVEPEPDEYAVRLTMELPADSPEHARDLMVDRLVRGGSDTFHFYVVNLRTNEAFFAHGDDVFPAAEAEARLELLDAEARALAAQQEDVFDVLRNDIEDEGEDEGGEDEDVEYRGA